MRQLFIILGLVVTPLWAGSTLVLSPGVTEVVRRVGILRVAVGNPKNCYVKVANSTDLIVTGVKEGTTSLHIWKRGEVVESLTVRVVSEAMARETAAQSRGIDVVRVSLELLEVDRARLRELGIQWPSGFQFSGGATFSDTSGLNYVVSGGSGQGWIRQALSTGNARRVAYPELFVRLGEEASFHSGGELPVASASENQGRYHRHIQWKPYGLSVRVKPKSENGYHIHSDVRVELSHLNAAQMIEGIPAITKRQVETKLRSLDGQTVFLSGLLSQEDRESKDSVPILGEIPLVGSLLFSSSRESAGRDELLMAITFSLTEFSEGLSRLEALRKEATPP